MPRILIIDDNGEVRGTMRSILEHAGHTVLEASDGADALIQLNAGLAVDLVVTDLVMPRIDGLVMIHALKRSHPTLPVVAVSGGDAMGPTELLLSAAGEGANISIPKPFRAAQLLSAVARLTGGKT